MRDADVIIVGAGAGGPVAAKTLAEAGVQVLVLEAGAWLDPERDYNRLENDIGSMLDGRLRWGPSDRSRPPWQRRRTGVSIILQAAGVGGTTRHYNGMAARAHVSSVNGDWPLGYDDLVPYYEQVESLLPVHRVDRLAPKDARFAVGCQAMGLPERKDKDIAGASWGHCHNAILPIADPPRDGAAHYPEVQGCTMCGHCLIGCGLPAGAPHHLKAKRATDVSCIPPAVATGHCQVIPDAFVTQIITERSGGALRARGVRWRAAGTGESHEALAPTVILAGGSVETPRLWLNSDLPEGELVGRDLTTHYQDFVTGFFDDDLHPDVGQVTMAKADYPGYGVIWSEGVGSWGFSVALTATGAGFWDDPVPPGEPWDTSGRAWGRAAVAQILGYRQAVTLAISVDDDSDPGNMVTVARDWPPDEHGPVPWVRYRPVPATRERQTWLARRAAEILRAAGAREIHRSAPARGVMAHIMGTMRMGADPGTSVVAPTGEAHAVAGLYLADASVLPNGLGGAPPSLTTQALALRTAQSLLDHGKAG